jgi:hypothetical protein
MGRAMAMGTGMETEPEMGTAMETELETGTEMGMEMEMGMGVETETETETGARLPGPRSARPEPWPSVTPSICTSRRTAAFT